VIYAIADTAFVTSEYPVILSFESKIFYSIINSVFRSLQLKAADKNGKLL
jgi:hypothetical protein